MQSLLRVNDEKDELPRVAVIDADRCKPSRCQQECRKVCPVVHMGKQCIEVSKESKQALISELLCNGCGLCVKRCPFHAIQIERIPKALSKECIYKYGPNAFQLHRLALPRPAHVLGLIGINAIGKSTILKVMSGKLKPNFGRVKQGDTELTWKEVTHQFRGGEWQNIFTKIVCGEFETKVKPQYVEQIAQIQSLQRATVQGALSKVCDDWKTWATKLELTHLSQSPLSVLSGGELQRLAIAMCASQKANMYLFDEPSSYLDIRQRIMCGNIIRQVREYDQRPYVVVVEHDLSLLDYLSDTICCLYGKPGVYGVVTKPFNVREGINHYLSGFIPTENLRFRAEGLVFKAKMQETKQLPQEKDQTVGLYSYESAICKLGDRFCLSIEKGSFRTSEIVVLLAENGSGKTSLLRHLKTNLKLHVSYKPQKINPTWKGTVQSLFQKKIPLMFYHDLFQKEVVHALKVEALLDRQVKQLSGGELQRVAIVLALGVTPCDIYLFDEPSAFLDCEQRILTAQVIKRFILQSQKSAFVVEHDFIMLNYLGDKIIVFDGTPGISCTARSPTSLSTGINTFLKSVNITIRRDPTNFRPRINKLGSVKDQAQKREGVYFDVRVDEQDTEE